MSDTIHTMLLLVLPERGTFRVLYFSFSQTLLCLFYHQLQPLCAVIIQHFSYFIYPGSSSLLPFWPHYPAVPPPPPPITPLLLCIYFFRVFFAYTVYLILLGCEVILPRYLQFIVPFKDTCGL